MPKRIPALVKDSQSGQADFYSHRIGAKECTKKYGEELRHEEAGHGGWWLAGSGY